MDENKKHTLQKAAGMPVDKQKTHEEQEDSVLKKIHKHVKHALAMGDVDTAMEVLEKIKGLIDELDKLQKDIKKEDKKD